MPEGRTRIAPVRREAALGVGDRAPEDVVGLPLVAVADADRALLLGQERHRGGELGEPGARGRHDPQQLEGGDDPVARAWCARG